MNLRTVLCIPEIKTRTKDDFLFDEGRQESHQGGACEQEIVDRNRGGVFPTNCVQSGYGFEKRQEKEHGADVLHVNHQAGD